jgi:galactose mutarotase-like enzyme
MSIRHTQRKASGFQIHTLANDTIALSIAPELGGRIVSLRDRISGREWLDGWSPASKRRIWHPTDPANFETGPGAGIDECLPTVLPCKINRKSLPDHGELWNQAPEFTVDPKAGFSCRWTLKSLPLAFERRISLKENEIRFDYQLENRADRSTPFLWAWHPLFSWKPGDQIHSTEKTCLSPGGTETLPWPESQPGTDLSRALFPKGATPAAKVFLGPLTKGRAEIRAKNGARLSLTWPASLFPYAGIWITRGFWKGLHHWAIEPTNAPVDHLSDVQEPSQVSLLAPREVRKWTLIIRLSA